LIQIYAINRPRGVLFEQPAKNSPSGADINTPIRLLRIQTRFRHTLKQNFISKALPEMLWVGRIKPGIRKSMAALRA
jgi:hypothetical protein